MNAPIRPLVSVIMAARNVAPFITASLKSILGQSLTDLECIVVDDGSTDQTREILERHATRDRRLRVVSQEGSGLPAALNAAWAMARGRYLARMDADDISLPRRLEKQATFMEEHPDIDICGTWSRTFGAFPWRLVRPFPDDARIRCEMLFNNPLSHPTVMMRREILDRLGGYDATVVYGEDYALWAKSLPVARFANIPEILLRYRRHSQQMGNTHAQKTQERENKATQAVMLGALGLAPRPEDLDVHFWLSRCHAYFGHPPQSLAFLRCADAWLHRLKTANAKRSVFPEPHFTHTLARYWFLACHACPGLGPLARTVQRQSDLAAWHRPAWTQRWSFWLDCLARRRIFPNIPYQLLRRLLATRTSSQ